MPSNINPMAKPTAVSKIDITDFTISEPCNRTGGQLPDGTVNMTKADIVAGNGENLGDALQFNGIDQYIVETQPRVFVGQNFPLSINVWVNIGLLTSFNGVVALRTGGVGAFSLRILASGLPVFRVNNVSITGITNIENDGWVMLTGIWADNTVTGCTVYVNGVLEGTGGPGAACTQVNPLTIGSGSNVFTGVVDPVNFFVGKMQGVRMWRQRILSAAEITKLFTEKR